jgi:hypothetical protein
VGRHVTSLSIAAPQNVLDLLAEAEADLLSATRVLSLHKSAVVEGSEFDLATLVKEIELAPAPEKGSAG